VFRGGFTLEAAEAVIDVSAWEEAPWEMDVVQSLLDRCMLRVWEPYLGHRRFYLYQSVHAYAEEKLCSPDAFGVPEAAIERVQARHAAHFSDLGTDESLEAMELRSGFALYRAAPFEIDNLIAAVDSADVANQPTTTVRCARAAFRILWRMGPFQRAIDLFERLGDITTLPLAERARLLWSVAIVLRFAGHAEEARGHLEMALKDAECVGDEALAGQIHGALGRVLVLCGDMALGRTHYDLSISLCRRTGARQGEGNTLSDLAIYHYEAGEVDPALARFEETLAIARELGQWRREAMVLNNVAVLLNSQGRLEEGTTSSKAALSIHREMGEKRGTVLALNTLAIAQRELEQFDDSQHSLEEALRLVRELGFRRFEGLIMGNLAELMELQGKLVEAEHLIEEAIEISEQIYPAVAGAFRGNLAVFRARRGEFKDARQLLEDGDALLRGVHELELGKLLCRRGEVECLTGDTEAARTALTEAEDIVAHMKVGPGSELYTMAHALRAKLEA
jgi:tetratricopeptide (TPR) repeat protein